MSDTVILQTPTAVDLAAAATMFRLWPQEKVPEAQTVICGRAAISLVGGPRTTKDLDVAIVFQPGAKSTINALKDRTCDDPLFVAGPITYMRLNPTSLIQVDMVDAAAYFRPWSSENMVMPAPPNPQNPGAAGIEILNVQTLLIQKIITVQERNMPDISLLQKKIASDIIDINFLLDHCSLESLVLTTFEQETLQMRFQEADSDSPKAAFQRVLALMQSNDKAPAFVVQTAQTAWNELMERSNLRDWVV